MKKRIAIIFILAILVTMTVSQSFATVTTAINDINVEINGKNIIFDVPPKIIGGRTMVPVKVIFEELGATVNWDGKTQTITAQKNNISIIMKINDKVAYVNSAKIELDVAPTIVNGRTLVPVKFISESFGAQVTWEPTLKSVIIKTEDIAEPIDPEVQKIAEELKSKIIIKDDLMIFTLFAFMNYTGYDDENSKEGFHSVRQAVREDLKKMDLKLTDNEYYKNKETSPQYYIHALKLMDSNFEYKSSVPNYLNKLSDLNVSLKEFYTNADIPNLYEKYKPEYQKEFGKYGDGIFVNLAKLIKFLKVDVSNVKPFYVNVNLLDAYYRGSGMGSGYTHLSNSGMIVTGPSEEPNYQNIVHEFLHGVITPIHNSNEKEINTITYLKESIPFESKELSSYQSLFSVYDESVIRSLTAITFNDLKQVDYEVKTGFVYTEYFADKFMNEYSSYNGTLSEFLTQIARNLSSK